eukprot:829191-Amorphochlora_amoeboformis.AAC.1
MSDFATILLGSNQIDTTCISTTVIRTLIQLHRSRASELKELAESTIILSVQRHVVLGVDTGVV